MADYRTKLTNEVINEAKEFFKHKIYKTIVPRSIRLSEAPGYGKPVMLYDKNSQGAKAYEALAAEFLSHNLLEKIELKQKQSPSLTQELEQAVSTQNTEQGGGDDGKT
jgi:nitrogenase subunit NifH